MLDDPIIHFSEAYNGCLDLMQKSISFDGVAIVAIDK